MQIVDTHVHLNFESLASDLKAVACHWRENGIAHLVHSCVHPGEFEQIQAIADQIPELSFSVGLHPLDAPRWTSGSSEQITQLAQSDPRVVAIGEMGLDFYKADDREFQEKVFEAQLEIAHALNKPVIIHCRDAAESMRDLLRRFHANHGTIRGVMHCWSGDSNETQWFLDLGFYISFSGVVTFKSAIAVQQSAQIVPHDRLLVETDCPFLAPVPKRGKRNEPAYVYYVAQKLAEIRQISLAELCQQTTQNACQLFGLSIQSESTLTPI
ncbi:MAG: TatD family hydrolase [Oscillatoriales cyanobacterium RM2_1_1]|nr:TatD family hydrolase [Oscillatoriales cyanobacterium SM2_3_0]NJO44744.1 TatD family hydrolase [Oscillatoriales cyanobacterium RM2_1_1]